VTEVARATSSRGGDLLLLRRHDGDRTVLELRVDGVFVMDTAETSSEEALAQLPLDAAEAPGHVVVAGLGLGCTLARVLADARVCDVTVVEAEAPIVEWLRSDVVPGGGTVLADPRVEVHVGDARAWIEQSPPGSVDVLLLDVDNGPDYLVHRANVALYQPPFLGVCAAVLTPTGVLAVWSTSQPAALAAALRTTFADVRTHACPVRLQGRNLAYWVVVATRPQRRGAPVRPRPTGRG